MGEGEIRVSNLDQLVPDTQQSGLIIDETDFIVKDVAAGTATIRTDVYVANGGLVSSGPVTVEVKAKELDAGLTADKQQTTLDNIDPEKITVASVPVKVPDQYNYRMEIVIWRNGTIVKRGDGIVQLRPVILNGTSTGAATAGIETSKFIVGDNQMARSPVSTPPWTKSPGFDLPAAMAALGAAGGFFMISRRRL